ncbi:OprO/OprP family phosphate-selective porin [Methylomarinum vadi]|uniref:OprO/OprP family phosphate-selective porin n=1 Tax=Methylomarinum vadi TaxID=438855 RepID=UPI00068EAC0D|nr:porin [Methylomarinum vadi]
MATNKTAKMLLLGTATALGSLSAQAADKELLDMLLQNGAINQTQYDTLIKKETLSKKDVDDIKIKLNKKGLQFETGDGDFKFAFGGRIQADATFHSNDQAVSGAAEDGTEIRRGRLLFKGQFWRDFKFMSEVDFADNSTAVKDMFVTYKGIDWLELTVGHQKQPISMELQESSNDIMFTERSLVNSLTANLFDRAIGIHAKSSGNDWSAQIGAYGESMEPNKNDLDEGYGIASRLTYAPINEKDQVLHLGTYGGYRTMDSKGSALRGNKGSVELSYETTHMSNLKLTKLKINNAKDFTMAGFESAYMYGPFSVQGEYAHLWADLRGNEPTLDFNAFYVQAGWTLTGESRTYKGSDGEFKRLKPDQNFSLRNGGWGAVELAARYDQNDLNSDGYNGGSEKAVTVALNWYLNENLRLMADYRTAFDISGSPVTAANGGDIEDVHAFTFRTQLAF